MKRLLMIALMAGGLAFVPVQRSDAQVSVGIGGVGIGFGYPGYRYGYNNYPYGYGYYPYGYYRTYPYYGYYRPYYGYGYGGDPYFPPPPSPFFWFLIKLREKLSSMCFGHSFFHPFFF